MFLKIWESLQSKTCWSCGKYLGRNISSFFFDHLIEKSLYPEFDLEEDNIYIVCEECHTKKTNGFPTEKHKEAIMKAKERFLEKEEDD